GRPHYDSDRDVVQFPGEVQGKRFVCRVSREALDDDFGAEKEAGERHMEAFRKHRATIEQIAANKFLRAPIDDANLVLVKSGDVQNPNDAAPRYAICSRIASSLSPIGNCRFGADWDTKALASAINSYP